MMKATKSKVVCILGMHRSGTSAVTRAINLMGFSLGKEDRLMPPKEGNNPLGFWEHWDFFWFNERLLSFLSHAWDCVLPLPENWWTRPETRPYVSELKELIKGEFGDSPFWVLKDPRISLVLPVWQQAFRELGIEASYIICIRNPLDVAASLKKRDSFIKTKSLTLWLLYNVLALQWTSSSSRVVIQYNSLLRDWQRTLQDISGTLSLPWPEDEKILREAMNDFISPSSCHSATDMTGLETDKEVPEEIVKLYRQLLLTTTEPEALGSHDFTRLAEELHEGYPAFLSRMYAVHQWELIGLPELTDLREKIRLLEGSAERVEEKVSAPEDHAYIVERDALVARQEAEILRLRMIEDSRSWITVKAALDFVDGRLFPGNSWRGKTYRTILRKLKGEKTTCQG